MARSKDAKAQESRKGVRGKSKKRKGDKKKIDCKYDRAHEGTKSEMIMRCKECPATDHSLSSNICLGAVIRAYSKEFNVDAITLSHHIETQYFGDSINILRMMIQFSNDLENFSLRDTTLEHFNNYAKEKKRLKLDCAKCYLNPQNVFANLRKTFIEDIVEFYSTFSEKVNKIHNTDVSKRREPCQECIRTTVADLNYVYDSFEDIAGEIVKSGFSIILGTKAVR